MNKKLLISLPVILLLAYNSLFFVLKSAQAITASEERKPKVAEAFIRKHIPKGSKVVGEPLYFYAVCQNESDFQYLNLYEDLEKREKYHREVYQYQYLLVTNHLKMRDSKGCINYYLGKAKFEKIATLEIKENSWAKRISKLSIGSFQLLSNVEKHAYNCIIYKRIE